MSESANHEGGLPVAVVSLLALLAVAAMLVSGWRFVSLYRRRRQGDGPGGLLLDGRGCSGAVQQRAGGMV